MTKGKKEKEMYEQNRKKVLVSLEYNSTLIYKHMYIEADKVLCVSYKRVCKLCVKCL